MNQFEHTDSILTPSERQVLLQACDQVKVPADIVEKMILAEHRVYGMGRRHGIWEELEMLIEEGVSQDNTLSQGDRNED